VPAEGIAAHWRKQSLFDRDERGGEATWPTFFQVWRLNADTIKTKLKDLLVIG